MLFYKKVLFALGVIFGISYCFALLEEEETGVEKSDFADGKHFGNKTLGHLIAEHFNKTGKFTNKPGKIKPTTTTTTTTTTTPRPTVAPIVNCTCGKGGNPRVNFTTATRSRRDLKEEDDTFDDETESVQDKRNFRIVHGVASREHGWPWMVALINGFSTTNSTQLNHFCGGSLINSQYILTAANCFRKFSSNSQIISQVRVVLGSNSISSNVTNRTVSTIKGVTIHPAFNINNFENDIAILQLSLPLNLTSTISPICLSQTGAPFNNRNAVVAGWGSTNIIGNTSVTFLREAGLRTMPNTKCIVTSPNLTTSMICTQGVVPQTSSEACRGDGGSPLMLFKPVEKVYTLIGLASNVPVVCGKTGIPTVFTRIGSFIQFIRDNTNSSAFCSNSFLP